MPAPRVLATKSTSISSFHVPDVWITSKYRLGRANPVMKTLGSLNSSNRITSSRTAGVAVAVSAMVGGLPNRRRNSPSRA